MYYIQLSILQGDWISAIGSLVGALIGGLIAYFIALSQVKQMKNEKKVEEIKKFYNVYFVLNPLLEKLKILLNEPSTEKERYPLDFPKDTLINHMMAHLSKESDAKSLDSMKEKKESLEMSYHHLHQIIKIKEELLDVNDTIVNLRSGHIPLEFYKTYQDIIYTLKRLIYLTEKFLFHDDDVSNVTAILK